MEDAGAFVNLTLDNADDMVSVHVNNELRTRVPRSWGTNRYSTEPPNALCKPPEPPEWIRSATYHPKAEHSRTASLPHCALMASIVTGTRTV